MTTTTASPIHSLLAGVLPEEIHGMLFAIRSRSTSQPPPNRDRKACEIIICRHFGREGLEHFKSRRFAWADMRTGADILNHSPRALLIRLEELENQLAEL